MQNRIGQPGCTDPFLADPVPKKRKKRRGEPKIHRAVPAERDTGDVLVPGAFAVSAVPGHGELADSL